MHDKATASGMQGTSAEVTAAQEQNAGERFAFGKNWQRFLQTIDAKRVAISREELAQMLQVVDLRGKTFLDIGCGSGLASFSAYQLGANVVSFDYDLDSVACTRELRRRWAPEASDDRWQITQGSALDAEFLRQLGAYDVVYSWGVLHHTGDLQRALTLLPPLVRPGGRLFLALYNDQGWQSRAWRIVKRSYCSGMLGRWLVLAAFVPYFATRAVAVGLLKYGSPWGEFTNYRRSRGMSLVHDWIDWLGGYPFEVAKPDDIVADFDPHGFRLRVLRTTHRLGCNQFVFERVHETRRAAEPPECIVADDDQSPGGR